MNTVQGEQATTIGSHAQREWIRVRSSKRKRILLPVFFQVAQWMVLVLLVVFG